MDKKECGDWLVIGVLNTFSSLNPIKDISSASVVINDLIFDGIIGIDEEGEIVPNLAESWTVSDDGKKYSLRIRKGVRFHDGHELDAEDIAFTLKMIKRLGINSQYNFALSMVEHIEIIDKYNVRIELKNTFNSFLSKLQINILPQHIVKDFGESLDEFSRNPIGTGPFIFKELSDNRVVLEANDDYFLGRPYIDGIVFRAYENRDELWSKLMLKEIDYTFFLSSSLMDFLQGNTGISLYPIYYRYYNILAFNCHEEIFRSKKIRKALNYSIDRKEILEKILKDKGRLCNGTVYPGTWAFHDQLDPYPYDPQLALKLLKEEGWDDCDGDGILEKEDRAFHFEALAPEGENLVDEAGLLIQEYFALIGVKIEIKKMNVKEMNQNYLFTRNFDAVFLYMYASTDPDYSYLFWHSSQIGKGLNIFSYRNTKVDAYLDRGRSALSREEAKDNYFRFQEEIYEDPPGIFFFWKQEEFPVHSRFHGVHFGGGKMCAHIRYWWVPKDEQKYHKPPL